jgi:hypothetical protein
MGTGPNLDQILKEIQRDSGPVGSAGAADIATHLSARPAAAPAIYTAVENSTRPANNAGDTARLLASGLTERQRRLPKIDFRMVGGVLAMLLLIIGVGTATVLTGQSQEIRQRAAEVRPSITPIPEFQAAASPAPETAAAEQPAAFTLSPALRIVLSAAGLIVVVGLVAFLFWAFVV